MKTSYTCFLVVFFVRVGWHFFFGESQKWWPQELELKMLELCEVAKFDSLATSTARLEHIFSNRMFNMSCCRHVATSPWNSFGLQRNVIFLDANFHGSF